HHGIAVGKADLGHLLAMGRAADIDAGPAVSLLGLWRTCGGGGRSTVGRPHRSDLRSRGSREPSRHPLFGDVVEHAPSGAIDRANRLYDRFFDPMAAADRHAGI